MMNFIEFFFFVVFVNVFVIQGWTTIPANVMVSYEPEILRIAILFQQSSSLLLLIIALMMELTVF